MRRILTALINRENSATALINRENTATALINRENSALNFAVLYLHKTMLSINHMLLLN